ncbi:MAG: hypothetical protein IH588_10670 [Anaerolineales bacterium]|nr:hypothetical protein [Anaerolineales bacterium]
MNKKIYNLRLFRYFRRLIYGKNPGNMSPTEKRKAVVETSLRWEDDGGPVVEVAAPTDPLIKNDPNQPADGSGNDLS